MKALQRPGRAAAVVGAVVAVSATSLIAFLGGTAAATEPGKCVENVNVRAEPEPLSEIVALCEAGTTVEVGAIRNGFVELVDLNGWAAEEFVSVNGAAPGTAKADNPPRGSEAAADEPGSANTGPSGSDGKPSEFATEPDGPTPPDGPAQPQPKPAPGGGPLSGLIPSP